jgi:hypothetical protein
MSSVITLLRSHLLHIAEVSSCPERAGVCSVPSYESARRKETCDVAASHVGNSYWRGAAVAKESL